MQSDVSLVQENIEGVKSLLDGINKRILAIETRITELENSLNSQKTKNFNDISNLKSQIKTVQTQHDKDIKNITNALSQLTALIDSNSTKVDMPKVINSEPKDKISDNPKYDDIPGAELLEMADKAYKSKEYLKASECFASLIKKNYKPAYSNFMLGEIEYFNKNYKNAIPYYDKSVAISQKGNYMPKLLYHTAISFDKIGDTNSANKFYKALKQAYPDSPEAKIAPDRK